MSLLILIIILAAGLFFTALPLFESLLGVLIATPILWFLIFELLRGAGIVQLSNLDSTPGFIGYAGILLILVALLARFFPKKEFQSERYYSLGFFIVVFSICYWLCLTWPDFIQMGERIRDYALLAGSVTNPLDAEEPWMAGAKLNYYPYWYRFGHMLHTLLSQPIWNVYHIMAAFSLATYATLLFRILEKLVGFTTLPAVVGALAIAFGSNVSGIVYAINSDDGWWGPSRVVAGAINEFPVWSFILGDLHPHYLNLSAIPLFILILFFISKSSLNISEKVCYSIFSGCLPLLFLFEANPWEIPMWAGFCGLAFCLCILYLIVTPGSQLKGWFLLQGFSEKVQYASGLVVTLIVLCALVFFRKNISILYMIIILALYLLYLFYFVIKSYDLIEFKKALLTLPKVRTSVFVLFFILIAVSLLVATAHIKPEGGMLRLVRPPILRTTIAELFLHWGIPITILSISMLLCLPKIIPPLIGFCALIISLLSGEAMIFIYTLVALQVIRLYHMKGLTKNIICEAIVLSGLGLILLPELIFLDDPYGGENERMNTIFKIYTTAWFFLHVGALYLLRKAVLTKQGVI